MKRIVESIIEVGKALYGEGLVDSHSGNISVIFKEHIFITRKGARLGFLSREDIIKLNKNKPGILKERASSEVDVHISILESTRKRCMVHAHPPYAIFYSLKMDVFKPKDWEGKEILQDVNIVDTKKPSASEELIRILTEEFKNRSIVIVKGHGVFSVHENLYEAYKLISVLEHSCKINFLEACYGKDS